MGVAHIRIDADRNPSFRKPYIPQIVTNVMSLVHKEKFDVYPTIGIDKKEAYAKFSYGWDPSKGVTQINIIVYELHVK